MHNIVLSSKNSQPGWVRDPQIHALEVGDMVWSHVLDYEIVLREESNQSLHVAGLLADPHP